MKRAFLSIVLISLVSLLYAENITYEEALAQIMSGKIKWNNKVLLKDFTAANYSQMDSVKGTIPVFTSTDASNIFTEKHGVYRFIMGENGIEKIIVNMVGLFPADHDPKQRYVLFRLNKYLDITEREEALYFPRQGGEIEFEFIVDNSYVSLYFEGDFTNLGKEFYFENDNEPFAADELSKLRNSRNRKNDRYSVKYKLVIPPTGNYTNREVFACHWTCTWMDCYYGAFNLVVVQEGATPEKRPVYIW